jgi:hypothetical protein
MLMDIVVYFYAMFSMEPGQIGDKFSLPKIAVYNHQAVMPRYIIAYKVSIPVTILTLKPCLHYTT